MKIHRLGPGSNPQPWVQRASDKPTTPPSRLKQYKYDFATLKATRHDVVGNETENNSADPQTLVLEKQHINHPEEPGVMANAVYDALKKPFSVFFIPNHCLKQHNVRKKKKKQKSEPL
ncbi:uncharacterized protein TNCV_4330921 [Trichonephila clavipes]|nr:uncharacterized protein TNCV_4330921 [Trichonephila clavipes]